MKKHLGLYLFTIITLVGGVLLGFAPICFNEINSNQISLFESLNYRDLGRYSVGGLLTVIFLLVGLLVVLISFITSLIKKEEVTGLKGVMLIFNSLILLTAASLYGCAFILFKYNGPVGISFKFDVYTYWGAIVGSIVTFLGGFGSLILGVVSFPKKESNGAY